MKKILAFLLSIILIVSGNFTGGTFLVKAENEGTQQSPALNLSSASAVLIEGSTGTILYEKKKDEKRFPASITKIMTLILIFQALDIGKIKLDDMVMVSEHAASMGGSQVYLEPNEKQTVDAMIKCICIASANDCCVAMAECLAGSETEFVKQMNEKAVELNMKNTHFLNCCGLDDGIDDGHYSSAYDVGIMSRELIVKHPEVSKYSTTWMDSITHVTKKGESQFGLTNTNKLVRTYTGITGLKTGSTKKAKYCLSATAKRDDMSLIAVVMGAPEPKGRFQEAATLLDYGFSSYSMYHDDNKEMKLKAVEIHRGVKKCVKTQIKSKFSCLIKKDMSKEKINKKISYTKDLTAPVKDGQKIGQIKYYSEGKMIGSVPIISSEKVDKAKFKDYFKRISKKFFIAE